MVGITALDSDAGLNGQVEYNLNSSNDYFSINATTGVIITRQTLTSNMSQQGFNLIATASDKVRSSDCVAFLTANRRFSKVISVCNYIRLWLRDRGVVQEAPGLFRQSLLTVAMCL